MIEFALSTFLKATPAVSALVGTNVYAEKIPQKLTAASIVYMKTGGNRSYHSLGSSGLVNTSIVLTFHAKQGGLIESAAAIYEAVRNAIDGFSGVMGTFDVRRCVLSPYAYGSALPALADQVGFPAVNATASIIHREAVPVFA